MNKLKTLLYSLLLSTIILIPGCSNTKEDPKTIQSEFNVYIDNIFRKEVTDNSITLNYTLSKPENYGIKEIKPTLGKSGLEAMENNLAVSENYLITLKSFPYESLTSEQQVTYDILKYQLELDQTLSNLLLHFENLSPTTGMQAQLPVLLAEYNFYTKNDIDHYLSLLPCVYDYFKEIVALEKKKSTAGLFMSDQSVDDIIAQCKTFINDKESNFLITYFNQRISTYEGLTKKEIETYQQENKKIVLNKIIPAYEYLINGLNKLKGTGINDGGLCGYKNGKKYYEYLVKSSSGSSKSMKEIDSLLDKTVNNCLSAMVKLVKNNSKLIEEASGSIYPNSDPRQIIEYLKSSINKDFPPLKNVNCTIKYVDKSLEKNLSPAFYLTPAIDNYDKNCIYINGSEFHDQSTLFTTIAHEGYPGHLYQTVYYNQQNPNPLRYLMEFGGYSEGWATYAELYSYHYAKIDETAAALLQNNLITTLVMYAKIDIGVNYYGWKLEDTTKYISKFGVKNKNTAKNIHNIVIEEPCNYLKYILGYLEIIELKEKAQKALDNKFVLKDFHDFILKTGPAPFDIIERQLDLWLKSSKNN